MKIALNKRIVLTVIVLIGSATFFRVPLAVGALSGRIAFVSSDPGAGLFIMNADGSSRYKVPLPYEPNMPIVGSPQWSPDGEWLTFHGATGHNGQIYIVRPDGTGFRRVTDGSGNLVEPSFSPDGMQITFCGPSGSAMYIINTDGTDEIRLPVDGSFPKWWPLGDKILYSNWGRTYDSDLFLYDLGTSTSTKITTHLPGQAFALATWSPDGTKLAVCVRGGTEDWDVWIMNADGSNQVNLTADWPTSNEDWVSWSPDGEYIVFQSDRSGNSDIWYMRTDGTNRINITNSPEDEWLPAIGVGLLRVLSPNGGETLVAESTYTISWESPEDPNIEYVYIEYSSDNGQNWEDIDIIENTGSYEWNPVPVVDSNECLTRISDLLDPEVSDTSDNVFTIFQCRGPIAGDLNGDCYVDWKDFASFAATWLDCGNPFDPDCGVE